MIWNVDLVGPRELCIRWAQLPLVKGNFEGHDVRMFLHATDHRSRWFRMSGFPASSVRLNFSTNEKSPLHCGFLPEFFDHSSLSSFTFEHCCKLYLTRILNCFRWRTVFWHLSTPADRWRRLQSEGKGNWCCVSALIMSALLSYQNSQIPVCCC